MKNLYYFIIFSTVLLTTGCVQSRYAWDNYDQKLYNYYKSPENQEEFIDDLKGIIAKSEASGRVPPGIFAEYGYVLYEKGNYSDSIEYFKKEQAQWPESNVLMAKMISNAKGKLVQSKKSDFDSPPNQATEVSQ